LFRLECGFRARGESPELIALALHGANALIPEPLDADEIEDIAASAGRYEPNLDLTEDGLAELFAAEYAGRVKYAAYGGWHSYADGVWRKDGSPRVRRMVSELLKTLEDSIRASGDETRLKRIRSFRNASPINGIIKLAEARETVFDDRPWDEAAKLVNFRNGTLELPAMTFRQHDPGDRLKKVLDYDYDPDATCPTFDKVLSDVLDPAEAAYLMGLLGHAISGQGGIQVVLVLVGSGKNGKTTVLEAVAKAMGEYAVSAAPTTFMKTGDRNVRNDVAALAGARLIMTSELNPGQTLDASLIKRMTGGDQVTARFLYQETFSFVNRGLMVMVTNHPPVFDGSDPAMVRRLAVLRFPKVIDDKAVDLGLPDKLKAEVPGIMNRLLEGFVRHEIHGLQPPPSVKAETDNLARSSNQVLQFLEDRCRWAADGAAPAGPLFSEYRFWAAQEGLAPMSAPAFKAAMERTTGVTSVKKKNGRFWPGIVLPRPG
jgi:putative DNA primase/helicase